MRLHQIKLAGFKSFVDATTISFPSNRVGVVGPNGCGKSNVIDAVRWVMGESSAKTLRGASMADVIFNGSRTRPKASFAEIELVFSEADLPQYPDMPEIGIKRRLGRDNKSQYFLNGVKCRRKDITSIFLGTGLGPRSYSIIEQGMISRFIEAKPEELRMFLEEAAGVSRYKEKRRETELRLQHTQDNMDRLSDLRVEMDKQVDKLRRQVRAAEKYKQLKEAEQLLKGQLLAMRWRNYNDSVSGQEQTIQVQAQTLSEYQMRLSELEELHGSSRETYAQANLQFNDLQASYYAHQSDIERMAQSMEHSKEKQDQLSWDLEQAQNQLTETRTTRDADESRLVALETDIFAAEAQLEEISMSVQGASETLEAAQDTLQTVEIRWESLNQQLAQPTEQIQVQQTRIQSLSQNLENNRMRLQRLEQENGELDLQSLESELAELNQQVIELESMLEDRQMELGNQLEAILLQREQNEEYNEALHQQQSQLQQAQGRLSGLEAMQEAALGKNREELDEWLVERNLHKDLPRLAQLLEVEQGWERAVETVLDTRLEALCIEDLSALTAQLDSLPQDQLTVIDTNIPVNAMQPHPEAKPLADKIKTDWDSHSLLAGIYVADNLHEALQLRAQLAPYESVITAQGLWLGTNWLSITEDRDQRAGVFAREQDIRQLQKAIETLENQVKENTETLKSGRETLEQQETGREQLQQQINQTQQQLSQLKASHGGHSARLEQMGLRARQLLGEHSELSNAIEEDDMAVQEAREQLEIAQSTQEELLLERENLTSERNRQRELVEQHRALWQNTRESEQQTQSQVQTLSAQVSHLKESMERLQNQITDLQEKIQDLQDNLQQAQPLDDHRAEYELKLAAHEALENQVKQQKEQVQQLESQLRQYEEEQRQIEGQSTAVRATLEKIRLEHQTGSVRRQTVEEQLAETDYDVETLLAELPEEANEEVWQEGIETLEKKILKLGSINLAALEEYEEQRDRQTYLQEQQDDIFKAKQMLEDAIMEIDTETRTLLHNTLDTINSGFQAMFPRLFGGGQANLRLLGEDILASGIAVMARPPGKRNSSIHLLSGGEKALTAVALVFAIFELNPAPFCMLDEVDAPLDDTNVSRFCNLVMHMSEHVQFIFISHNKVAMEMADQLIGVTMQEPGVSRSVAVDIDLAVEMAEM
ncbi:chromosome segregation protein SMC [Candidatus Venteria ishoeyi]|uniref:Chromosome partition protein Smc n=1 Tax=Candidatus Venteria ishoeyi TaxID=1899563 RepID=A0A1H6FFT5_9GAMM|nr:chromosome segregation protein SMC [Candidatus Venteria ishoeyi]SEH08261.1 Chromosome partition protein Smc [Candidatus Venteria ishoeyi]